MSASAFRPASTTFSIDVAATSDSVSLAGTPPSVRIHNDGSATAWVAFGPSDVEASASASMPVGAGSSVVVHFSNPDGGIVYAAAIAAGETGKVYFTPGSGG